MTSEAKPIRKVRFNLPEQKYSIEQKPYEGKRRASDSALKKSTISPTPSIIINKNATSFKKKSNNELIVKPLPKIPERPKVAKITSNNSDNKQQQRMKASSAKPRPTMTRSQSLSCKRVLSDIPSVEITEMDYQAVVAYERPQFNVNFLKAPLPEDDNANYLLQNRSLEKDTHDVLKGKFGE